MKLTNVGIFSGTKKSEIKKIKVINYCNIIMAINIIFFFALELILEQMNSITLISYFFQSTIVFSIYVLNFKAKYVSARIILLCFSYLLLFYNANFAYKGFYGEYMYVMLPLVSLFFFSKKWIHFLVLIVSILSFYIPNEVLNIYPEKYFGYTNVVFLFFGSFLTLFYFKQQNIKNENYLEKLYQELKKQKKWELAHLQLQSLKAQMNPHFMFNALNSIQNLILKEDKNKAYTYLSEFSALIRENLNMSEKSYVSFTDELSLLQKYLDLEQLRFRDNFSYFIYGADKIDDIKIPSMIIQPFVENAIKHGLLHKIEFSKKLTITFKKKEVLECTIKDNGIGIEASKKINLENNTKPSFSTASIKNKLSFYKEYYQLDIGFTYKNVPEGTEVLLKIPYQN